jgi:hypothetical protein
MNSAPQNPVSGCNFKQAFVDQTPKYSNQVLSKKTKILRPDKRKKHKYL